MLVACKPLAAAVFLLKRVQLLAIAAAAWRSVLTAGGALLVTYAGLLPLEVQLAACRNRQMMNAPAVTKVRTWHAPRASL
jgi:hypothetical protein